MLILVNRWYQGDYKDLIQKTSISSASPLFCLQHAQERSSNGFQIGNPLFRSLWSKSLQPLSAENCRRCFGPAWSQRKEQNHFPKGPAPFRFTCPIAGSVGDPPPNYLERTSERFDHGSNFFCTSGIVIGFLYISYSFTVVFDCDYGTIYKLHFQSRTLINICCWPVRIHSHSESSTFAGVISGRIINSALLRISSLKEVLFLNDLQVFVF